MRFDKIGKRSKSSYVRMTKVINDLKEKGNETTYFISNQLSNTAESDLSGKQTENIDKKFKELFTEYVNAAGKRRELTNFNNKICKDQFLNSIIGFGNTKRTHFWHFKSTISRRYFKRAIIAYLRVKSDYFKDKPNSYWDSVKLSIDQNTIKIDEIGTRTVVSSNAEMITEKIIKPVFVSYSFADGENKIHSKFEAILKQKVNSNNKLNASEIYECTAEWGGGNLNNGGTFSESLSCESSNISLQNDGEIVFKDVSNVLNPHNNTKIPLSGLISVNKCRIHLKIESVETQYDNSNVTLSGKAFISKDGLIGKFDEVNKNDSTFFGQLKFSNQSVTDNYNPHIA